MSIGVGEKVECGGKEVKQGRGYTSALRDPIPGMKREERVKLYRQLAVRPFKQPDSKGLVLLRGGSECADEFGVVNHIESFGKINCLGQSAEWGTGLVKALSYFICKRQEGTGIFARL